MREPTLPTYGGVKQIGNVSVQNREKCHECLVNIVLRDQRQTFQFLEYACDRYMMLPHQSIICKNEREKEVGGGGEKDKERKTLRTHSGHSIQRCGPWNPLSGMYQGLHNNNRLIDVPLLVNLCKRWCTKAFKTALNRRPYIWIVVNDTDSMDCLYCLEVRLLKCSVASTQHPHHLFVSTCSAVVNIRLFAQVYD